MAKSRGFVLLPQVPINGNSVNFAPTYLPPIIERLKSAVGRAHMKSLLIIVLGLLGSWYAIDLGSQSSLKSVGAPIAFGVFLMAALVWLAAKFEGSGKGHRSGSGAFMGSDSGGGFGGDCGGGDGGGC